MRETIMRHLDHDPRFNWRGGAVTRIENLSDIVFALALGMLVSSSSAVVTFSDLTAHLWNIIPVAAGFALLLLIWNAHFTYFRRYGVADGQIIFLNACLLLVVLFLAYPLRFIFDSLFGFILMSATGDQTRLIAMEVEYETSGKIMAYFAVGYALVFAIYLLMYLHAPRHAQTLGLNASERAMTLISLYSFVVQIACAALVFALAVFTPLVGFAGAFLVLVWPLNLLVRFIVKVPAETPGDKALDTDDREVGSA